MTRSRVRLRDPREERTRPRHLWRELLGKGTRRIKQLLSVLGSFCFFGGHRATLRGQSYSRVMRLVALTLRSYPYAVASVKIPRFSDASNMLKVGVYDARPFGNSGAHSI